MGPNAIVDVVLHWAVEADGHGVGKDVRVAVCFHLAWMLAGGFWFPVIVDIVEKHTKLTKTLSPGLMWT